MEKILSQEEVDALLRGISDGEVETQPEQGSDVEGIRSYDLTSQDRIIRGRMPTLEIINDRFARLYRTSMSASLRKVIDVTVTQTEMIKFGEFIRTLPVPTSLHILRMEPLRGHALLVLESRLIFNLVDCFFGGTGKSAYVAGQVVTVLLQFGAATTTIGDNEIGGVAGKQVYVEPGCCQQAAPVGGEQKPASTTISLMPSRPLSASRTLLSASGCANSM